jgi:signal transduction histidine kinase
MKGLRDLFPAPASKTAFGESRNGNPGLRPNVPISMQRAILGIGIAVLAVSSAASISLEVKSRTDAAWVSHTLEVLNKITDMRSLLRRAESAVRGYLLTEDPYFLNDYHWSLERVAPAFVVLKETIVDNAAQMQVLESCKSLVARRFSMISDSIPPNETIDSAARAALLAKAEGSVLMGSIDIEFDQLAKEEQRLLEIRSEISERTGRLLLATDLLCGGMILVLATILVRDWRRSGRQQESLQRATEAENEGLETAIAERTRHLLEVHERLRHTASMLNATFAGMTDAVLVVDNDGKVALSNSSAERILRYHSGMTVAEWQAQNVAYHPEGSTPLALDDGPIARALRGEQFDGVELVVHGGKSHDPIYLLVSGRPLLDASGAIIGGSLIFRDVTGAREIERKFHQSQRLDAIGKLTGGVAHDFNNMLTVIGGATEILLERLSDQPDLQVVAALINQAADRCTELVQHLLAFARKQPLRPRNVDINITVVDIAKLLRPTLGEQIEVDSILEEGLSAALVDPSQLANALINLSINARDAMPDGGKLMLETENVVLDAAYARANADVQPGEYVMIAVTDTGTGMSAEMCEKVFEPFFTTKELGKGTGLGLSMVYGFVKQSCGHIKIYSELGHGTTMRLYLPAADGFADAALPVIPPIPGAGEIILVVEDDGLVRGFVIAQLHSLGYRTVAATNGQDALAHLDSGRPFDLLFTDVVMPGGITGRQLADEVVRRRPGAKVLYTSGYTENAIVHQGRLDSGVMLLSKPYRKSELSSMVRRALGDAVIEGLGSRPTPLADTSIVIPMRRQVSSGQALSSG